MAWWFGGSASSGTLSAFERSLKPQVMLLCGYQHEVGILLKWEFCGVCFENADSVDYVGLIDLCARGN